MRLQSIGATTGNPGSARGEKAPTAVEPRPLRSQSTKSLPFRSLRAAEMVRRFGSLATSRSAISLQ
jgi:hypothetical protein